MNKRIIDIIEKFKIDCKRSEDWIEVKDTYGTIVINQFDDELEVCLVNENYDKYNHNKCYWATYDEVIGLILLEMVNKGLK